MKIKEWIRCNNCGYKVTKVDRCDKTKLIEALKRKAEVIQAYDCPNYDITVVLLDDIEEIINSMYREGD